MSTTTETIKIGSVQINNSFSGHSYFPYSTGLLQAYAQKHLKNPDAYEFLLPIYNRIKIEDAVDQLEPSDIVLFSLYVWNERITLRIAEILKSRKPEIVIIFGGPQVPNTAESFLRNHPFIDVAAHGPGERVICQLLESALEKNWESIPGVSYLIGNEFQTNAELPRTKQDVENIVSPYLSGVFDKLMESNPESQWLALWETNRGCPFSCTFCDWGSATASKVFQFDIDTLHKEVDWFSDHKIEFIFCCDANFGIVQRDVDIANYVIDANKRSGYPQALSVQNTKNAKERAYTVQKLLSDAGLNKGVTLSMQSVDTKTLENIKRSNISLETYKDLQERFNRDRIETYNDLIIALPGESYDSFVEGIDTIISNGQHNRIQFNNLSILPNAEMGNPEYQKQHGMELVESDIINVHGSINNSEEIIERQLLVIGTNTMPKEDWIKTRALCWLTALLHFDKILQIPIVLTHELGQVRYRDIIESFYQADESAFPITRSIVKSFIDKALDIQSGGVEYCGSDKWLNILWPADELAYIELATSDQLAPFYEEAKQVLSNLLLAHGAILDERIIEQSFALNYLSLKMPNQTHDEYLTTDFNILECYRSAILGESVKLKEVTTHYIINKSSTTWSDWQEWCREVVWYGNKKGAYLYEITATDNVPVSLRVDTHKRSIAGHY